MGMKVKNWDLERLLASKPEIFGNKKLSVKLIYWLSRLQKDVEIRFKEYGDARVAMFEKYCLRNEDGTIKYGQNGEFNFPPEKTEAVAKELNELRLMEVEVASYNKIKLDLNDKTLEGVLSPNDLAVIEPFVEIIEPA